MFDEYWHEVEALIGVNVRSIERNNIDMDNPHDVYHPVGTCKMGEGDEDVVDYNLKAYGVCNLYILSTAVFQLQGRLIQLFHCYVYQKKWLMIFY